MPRAEIVIKGGHDVAGAVAVGEDAPATRGQDIAVMVRIDGRLHRLPVTSLVLRVKDRKARAMVEFEVDEVEITGIGDVAVNGATL